MNKHTELASLIKVVNKLRDPDDGCPWDLKQTHKSLLKYLIEESYEFIHATEENDIEHMEEEMGDVLLQVLLHTTIAEQNNSFTLESVSKTLKEKLVRRHPHVFKNKDKSININDVVTNWDKIKSEEKDRPQDKTASLIDKTYLAFPALFSSYKIGNRTSKIQFDWDNHQQVLEKVEEEFKEFKDELSNITEKTEEEFGDLLFSMAQLGRHLGFDPENSLRQANKKFLRRFQKMEYKIQDKNLNIKQMNQADMDIFWNQVKQDEKA